mmetsp:Transcript_26247/g.32186  ORF Transcript_26247/g.32186 Transcript_26247/m.32186 type:complete len:87 (-) Transcript_26247:28-288(-)
MTSNEVHRKRLWSRQVGGSRIKKVVLSTVAVKQTNARNSGIESFLGTILSTHSKTTTTTIKPPNILQHLLKKTRGHPNVGRIGNAA